MNDRSIYSPIMLSHITLIIPCVIWIIYSNAPNQMFQILDRCMSIGLTIAIMSSLIYHYHQEKIMIYSETYITLFSTIMLNIYMYLYGVNVSDILIGIILLMILGFMLCVSRVNDNYEKIHHICHYISGVYVMYCVYFILRQQKLQTK